MAQPWEMDWGKARAGGGGLEAVPLPERPSTPNITWRQISPDEAKNMGLPINKRFQVSNAGEIKPIGGEDKDDTNVLTPEQQKEIRAEALQKIKLARSLKERSKGGWFTTGFGAPTMAKLAPSSGAGGVAADVETLRAAGALQRIMELTQRTGKNPLTPISNADFIALGNSLANLDIGQSDEQFQRNVGTAEDMYRRAYEAAGGTDLEKDLGGGEEKEESAPPPKMTPSDGKSRSEIDPKLKAMGERIAAVANKGADKKTIMGFAVRLDPTLRSDPRFVAWVDEAIRYRKENPGARFPVDPSFYTREIPLSGGQSMLNDAAQSAPGAYAARAANMLSMNTLDNAAGMLGGDPEQVRMALGTAGQLHPNASLAGDLSGGVLAALGGEAALAKLGMAAGKGRGLVADMLFGAGAGAGDADDGDRLMGAGVGAGAGALGNFLGRAVTAIPGKIATGVSSPSVRAVAEQDIPLTLGQAVGESGRLGKMVKGVEDRLSGIPVVGDMVNTRRLEGLQKMNSRAFDRALEPIGGNSGGKFGEEAVAAAQEQVGKAFDKALKGKTATLDRPFVVEAEKAKMALEKLPDRVRDEVNGSIDEVVNNYFDDGGNISGPDLQAALRELGDIRRAYKNDPLGNRIGKVVDQFTDSVENLFRRQAPDVMPQYDAAKKAFKRLSTLEDAVLRGKETNGVFTSAQLGMSDKANTIKFGGKHAAAAGKGEFHDFERAAQNVLPNRVPDSGTAGRVMLPLAIVGAGAGGGAAGGDAGAGTTVGLGLAGLLSLAYSKTGQHALTSVVLPKGKAGKAVGGVLRKASPLAGHLGASGVIGLDRE